MKPQTKFRRILSHIGTFLLIGIVMYGFLALCNWNIHLQDWTGFPLSYGCLGCYIYY